MAADGPADTEYEVGESQTRCLDDLKGLIRYDVRKVDLVMRVCVEGSNLDYCTLIRGYSYLSFCHSSHSTSFLILHSKRSERGRHTSVLMSMASNLLNIRLKFICSTNNTPLNGFC